MNKKVFILLIVFALLVFSQLAQPMRTAIPTLQDTRSPTDTRLPTLTPRPSSTPHPPTPTTYPTASTIKANAVAFIENSALWIANIDGSGEKKLAEMTKNSEWLSYSMLRWSPDGKWISYLAGDALWAISPDGAVKRKVLDIPINAWMFTYEWSPNSSKIAYHHRFYDKDKPTPTPTPGPESGMDPYRVGMIDVATGKVSVLSSHDASVAFPVLKWSHDERNLLFIKDRAIVLLDVATRQIVKTIKRGCGLERNLSVSPNGKWFSYTDNGVGRYFHQWICVASLRDASVHKIDVDDTVSDPVWDKTGNYLYFIARKINPDSDPNLQIDERLMRYDAQTQKTELLLSLRKQQTLDYIASLALSPDGHTLAISWADDENQRSCILLDLKSKTTRKFAENFVAPPTWSADSQNFIYILGGGGYVAFYKSDIQTGETTNFSSGHAANDWAVSPIATAP